MREHMNIGIVAWSLFETKGGIERNACNLAAAMMERGHKATIFYKQPWHPKASPVYPPPAGAPLVGLALDYDTLTLETARKQLLDHNLDVLVAMFSWESLLWIPALLKGTNIRLIISEHNNPERVISKWNAHERHCCMLTADAIRVLVDNYAKTFPANLRERVSVIHNPAYLTDSPPLRPETKDRYTLLGAGRFIEDVKQFSLLINAFALLQNDFPDWDLELCGDGPSFADYAKRIEALGMQKRIRMPGMVSNIGEHYCNADLFCVPSRVEGLCMVGIEAQHYSLPAVGFAECSGVNDIIVHGENGFLVEDMTPEALAEALSLLMRDPALRKAQGDKGKAMLDRYAPQKIFSAWEKLLWATVKEKGPTRLQVIEQAETDADAEILAARMLLSRPHPFDRSACIHMHEELLSAGGQSPFSDRHINGFKRKHEKFCLPGHATPAAMARKGLRRLKQAVLSFLPLKQRTGG